MGCTGSKVVDGEIGDIVQIQHTGDHVAHQTAAVAALDGCDIQREAVHLDEMTVILCLTHQTTGAVAGIDAATGNGAVRDLQMGSDVPQLAHQAAGISRLGGGEILHGAAGQGEIELTAAVDCTQEAAQAVSS